MSNTILDDKYVLAFLSIIAYAYAQKASPPLPTYILNTLSYDIIRVIYLFLLLVLVFKTRATVALIISLVFIYILQYIDISKDMSNTNLNNNVTEEPAYRIIHAENDVSSPEMISSTQEESKNLNLQKTIESLFSTPTN